ncbi:NADPH:quinone reductase [Phaeobacter inhibens]|uniref:Quinone oxidoreductase-like protein n=1 Tax=Phaeobacter inhibens TaxID=221822 RepID=A0A2I7K4W2_9RHOB|nr:NADPH:quinone reductase [Phaeobacter inhibens]AUQ97644.1 quinone oxidoreductase-like protein [Phaeobacter inhibens]
MKAITYRAFGSAETVLQLEDLPDIAPARGELRVELAYSGVNPSDVKARAGARAGVSELPYPVIVPHSDGSGVIVEVGEGVDPARIGEEVWIWNGQWQRPNGTAACSITLAADQAVVLPAGLTLQQGAVLGIPGLTAAHTVFSGGDVGGKTVLVQGGAGTVGLLAVQLAKWGGARVVATCSSEDFDRVRRVGADAVLSYAEDDLAEQILAANGGRPVDHIVEVEFGANCTVDTAVIAPNGRITAYGSARNMTPNLPFYSLMFKAVTLEMALVYLLPAEARHNAIERINAAAAQGALQPPIAAVFDLVDTAKAHHAVEAGKRAGAILVKTG